MIHEGLVAAPLFGHEAIGVQEVCVRYYLEHAAAGAPAVEVFGWWWRP